MALGLAVVTKKNFIWDLDEIKKMSKMKNKGEYMK